MIVRASVEGGGAGFCSSASRNRGNRGNRGTGVRGRRRTKHQNITAWRSLRGRDLVPGRSRNRRSHEKRTRARTPHLQLMSRPWLYGETARKQKTHAQVLRTLRPAYADTHTPMHLKVLGFSILCRKKRGGGGAGQEETQKTKSAAAVRGVPTRVAPLADPTERYTTSTLLRSRRDPSPQGVCGKSPRNLSVAGGARGHGSESAGKKHEG